MWVGGGAGRHSFVTVRRAKASLRNCKIGYCKVTRVDQYLWPTHRGKMVETDPKMGATPGPLPRFNKPPIIELAFSVQFDPLPGFKTVHYGKWADRVKERFPVLEDQPPLDDMVEVFDSLPRRVAVQFVEGVPPPRVWYITKDKGHLIQLQNNRIVYNWRKLQADDAYPSYEKLREKFRTELGEFLDFVKSEQLGEFRASLCELAYFNHIFGTGVWNGHYELDKVLSLVSGKYSELYLPPAERFQFHGAWVFRDEGGAPLGRLRLTAVPEFRMSDRQPVFVTQMTARGVPRGQGIDGILGFMDIGHEWIVRGFAAVTTPEMHAAWERQA